VSPHAIVWLATAVALVIVLAMTGMQALRALREVSRLGEHVEALAGAPVLERLERVDADVARLENAAAALPLLIARAQAALVVIRRGPIPPELLAAIRFVRSETAAFRLFARR
jgi:hypothetical protein